MIFKGYKKSETSYFIMGFTIIEILVSIAIIVLLLSVTFESFMSFKKNRIVAGSAERIAVLLSEARSSTLSSKGGSQYGVHFSSNSATLYQDSYSSTNPENKIVGIDSPGQIEAITLLGGGENVLFNKLTGETSQYGTVTISSTEDQADVRVITISQSGLIEMN